MKQKLFLLFVAGLFAACNSDTKTASDEAKVKTASTEEPKMEYAYTIEHPDNWETGPRENTKLALQALKDFETGNIEACLTAFADSVELRFDEMEGKFSKDSVRAMFTRQRSSLKDLKIDMSDFESVKSKDGSEQYVSLWYKEKWQGQNGVWDSLSMMDDVKIENGKIILLDEKARRYAKKKM
jgi:hypothetical protein